VKVAGATSSAGACQVLRRQDAAIWRAASHKEENGGHRLGGNKAQETGLGKGNLEDDNLQAVELGKDEPAKGALAKEKVEEGRHWMEAIAREDLGTPSGGLTGSPWEKGGVRSGCPMGSPGMARGTRVV